MVGHQNDQNNTTTMFSFLIGKKNRKLDIDGRILTFYNTALCQHNYHNVFHAYM